MSAYEVVTASLSVPPGSDNYYSARTITAQCPSGKSVVGGGYYVATIASSAVVSHSRPTTAGTGWEAYVYNGASDPIDSSAYAICVKR